LKSEACIPDTFEVISQYTFSVLQRPRFCDILAKKIQMMFD